MPGLIFASGSRIPQMVDRVMTSSYVAQVVRNVLTEREMPDTIVSVAALSFSWEVVLRSPSGVEQHVILPITSPRTLTDTIRSALAA